jgi:hypothetical protein
MLQNFKHIIFRDLRGHDYEAVVRNEDSLIFLQSRIKCATDLGR